MGRPTIEVEGFWDRPLHELFELLPATPAGLTTEEARRRLRFYGPNSFVHESRFAVLLSFLGFFRNPLVVILVIASGVSLALEALFKPVIPSVPSWPPSRKGLEHWWLFHTPSRARLRQQPMPLSLTSM